MGTPINLMGQRFGKLEVVCIDHLGVRNTRHWLCLCDCGNTTVQIGADLKNGKVKSCGCGRYEKLRERNTKHGCSTTRLYRIWRGMISRCNYPSASGYKNYGARGIKVCDEWFEFETFADWAEAAGYAEELTIERVDVNGDYCPENCKWIPWSEQYKNKRERSSIPDRDPVTGRFLAAVHDIHELLKGGEGDG